MNNLSDAKISLILREENGKIKGSFRTTDDNYDVGRLASLFGGGGHKKAAGFTISGRLFFDTTQNIWKIV
jgi:phosphoesterase RecJ-like protein